MQEKPFERAGVLDHAPEHEEQCREVPAVDPPVDERFQPGMSRRLEALNECTGRRADYGEEPVDGLDDASHTPERQSRGTEARNLTVGRIAIPAHQVHRVCRRIVAVEVVVLGVEDVAAAIERYHVVIGIPFAHMGHSSAV